MFETVRLDNILIVETDLEKSDMSVAAEFQRDFYELIKNEKGLVLLDLEKVAFMDSSGLAALVFSFRSLELPKRLAVCRPRSRVKYLFKLAKMNKKIQIFDTREEALRSLGREAQTS